MVFLKIKSCFGLSSISLVQNVNMHVHEYALANENRRHIKACPDGNSVKKHVQTNVYLRGLSMITYIDYHLFIEKPISGIYYTVVALGSFVILNLSIIMVNSAN